MWSGRFWGAVALWVAGCAAEELNVKNVEMPMLSSTMTEGVVSVWHKAVGDRVEVGSILLTAESDKAEMDVESFEEGYLAKILVEAGETAKVGAVLALLVPNPEDIGRLAGGPPESSPSESSPAVSVEAAQAPEAPPVPSNAGNPVEMSDSTDRPTLHFAPATQAGGAPPPSHRAGAVDSSVAEQENLKYRDFSAFGIDQDVKDQIPKDMSPEDLSNLLFDNANGNPEIAEQLRLLEESKGGAEFLKSMKNRAALRAPQANVLAAVDESRKVTLQNVQALDIMRERGKVAELLAAAGAPGANASPSPSEWQIPHDAITATPNARILAKKKGLDVNMIRGTGNYGRVTQADVNSHLKPNSAAPPKMPTQHATSPRPAPVAPAAPAAPAAVGNLKPLTGMQKAIAKNMAATLNVPVFRLTRGIAVQKLQELYKANKSRGVTWSSLLAKAVALTLAMPQHALINASFDEPNSAIRHHSTADVAMAVASPDGGLLTPVLREADRKGIVQLSKDWASLVDKVRNKSIKPADCAGGTFYISNLGQFGIKQFDAILPPGAGAILSVGSTEAKGGGAVLMNVTITCDHRHINGANAAEFLQDLAKIIQDAPEQILASP